MYKVLLIEPDEKSIKFKFSNIITSIFNLYSLTFPQLAAVTPPDFKIDVMDEKTQKLSLKKIKNYDLIGISTMTCNAIRAYEIADYLRSNGKKVVLGGWHPSALPEEAKKHADSVLIGEAENTWPELLNDYKNKRLKTIYEPKKPVDIDRIPNPQLRVIKGFHIIGATFTSRGCNIGCNFCSISHSKFGNKLRSISINKTIERLKEIPVRYIDIQDPSMTLNPIFTKNLFKEMKNLNKRFLCMGNINVLAKDDELLNLASEAGCVKWFIGFESINQNSVTGTNKPNKVKNYISAINKIHDRGMMVEGGFIFGFDEDTKNVFSETDDFVNKSGMEIAHYCILTPFPGTPLYSKFEKEGRIITKDWRLYDLNNVVFKPKNMTSTELSKNVQKIREKYFETKRCVERISKSIKYGFWPFLIVTQDNILPKLVNINA